MLGMVLESVVHCRRRFKYFSKSVPDVGTLFGVVGGCSFLLVNFLSLFVQDKHLVKFMSIFFWAFWWSWRTRSNLHSAAGCRFALLWLDHGMVSGRMTLHFLCCLIPGVCLVWQTFVEMEVWGKGFSCCGAIEFLVLCHVPWCNEMSWWWAIECCKWIGFTPANPCVWRESHSTCISFCLLTQSSCGSCFYIKFSNANHLWNLCLVWHAIQPNSPVPNFLKIANAVVVAPVPSIGQFFGTTDS